MSGPLTVSVQAVVEAPASAVFDLLADPARLTGGLPHGWSPSAAGRLARLGCTRGGSPGIFG